VGNFSSGFYPVRQAQDNRTIGIFHLCSPSSSTFVPINSNAAN
jgi:hypothetical protein